MTTTTSFTEQVLAIVCKPEAVAAMKSGGACPSFIETISLKTPPDITSTSLSTLEPVLCSTPVEGEIVPPIQAKHGQRSPWGNWTYINYADMPAPSLDTYIRRRSMFFNLLPKLVNKRAAELAPALLEMERRYNKQPGARTEIHELAAPGWHEYLKSVGVNPSTFRTWKRGYALKRLEAMVVDPTKPKPVRNSGGNGGGGGSTRSTAVDSPDSGDAIMRKAAIRLAKIMTNPLLTQDEKMQQATYRAEEYLEAEASGNYTVDPSEPDAEHNPITPGLSPMTVPVPALKDANEALLEAAFAAATTAANKVVEIDIKARFYPVLTFYSGRHTIKFAQMLKARGLRGSSHRGKTGYALSSTHRSDALIGTAFAKEYRTCVYPNADGSYPTRRDVYFATPAYKTFEEAWEFVKGFDDALPDLHIEYGVFFEGDDFGGTLHLCGEPEPSHGG